MPARGKGKIVKLQLGDLLVKCPYCEATEFVAADEGAEPREVVCACCGGYASRRVLLERLRVKAAAKPADRNGGK